MVLVGLVAALLAGAVGVAVARVISGRVGRMVSVLDAVSNGDLTRRADVTGRDEIGVMAAALDTEPAS